MRDPRNALKPFAVKEAETAREKLAVEAYKIDAIKAQIIEAAQRGETRVRIRAGEALVDLSSTEAAQALVAWAKDNGLNLSWERIAADRPNGLRVIIAEPVLQWAEERTP
jgi:hypothetical protein